MNQVPLMTVCGPCGVGKTTVVESLAGICPAYIETPSGNPHLKALLEGKEDFNAAANQQWFLGRIGEFVRRTNPRSPLVLDQDPAAIVLAYSRMFQEDGFITETQYSGLMQTLIEVEEMLQRWRFPRVVLFLEAPAELLHQRIVRRWGKSHTPPLAWFVRVRTYFRDLSAHFPQAFTLSTADLAPAQIVSRARQLLERGVLAKRK